MRCAEWSVEVCSSVVWLLVSNSCTEYRLIIMKMGCTYIIDGSVIVSTRILDKGVFFWWNK
jgi:hypothetical protein